ncbi:MAG: bifunctional nuclease family protein [Chloroflexi bacterium]|nr:bifunctional nuclease family protein [Chloroflexota bacterium]
MSVDTTSADIDLVARARRGDTAAYGELVGRHRSALYANCVGLLRDAALAEDAVQEAILRAMLGVDHLRDPDRFSAWLTGIGLNVCRGMMRTRSRGDWSWRAIQGGHLDGLEQDAADPQIAAEASDTALGVRAAVAALPSGQREAVVRFYLEGLTIAETAQKLGIGTGAVKTRLHKARVTLRRRLADLWKEAVMPATRDQDAVEVRVADVRRAVPEQDAPTYHMVVLEEVAARRRLPIWIGEYEGTAIALQMEGVRAPRPLTFGFMADILQAAGARLREVRISKLVDGTFYAVADVEGRDGRRDVDCRPSDAISLALSMGAPMRVVEGVCAASDEHLASPSHEPLPQDKYYSEGAAGAAEIVAEVVSRWRVSAS